MEEEIKPIQSPITEPTTPSNNERSLSDKSRFPKKIIALILVLPFIFIGIAFAALNYKNFVSSCTVTWTSFPKVIYPSTNYTIYINKVNTSHKWRDVSVFKDLDIQNSNAYRESGLTGDAWDKPSNTYTLTFNSGEVGTHKLYFYNNDFKSYGEKSGTGPKTLCQPVFTFTTSDLVAPTPTQEQTNSISDINTVSYATVSGKIILRYQDKFFDKAKNLYEPEEISLSNANSYNWIKLVNRPESETSYVFDEMFSFDTLPNNLGFIFVMRWVTNPKNLNGGLVKSEYKVFYFNGKTNKLTNVLSFEPSTSQDKYQIPKIDKISSDGKFVSFSMFGCWNCGGHYPETLLLNIESIFTKTIGKVKDFTWGENGKYTYKEYKIIDCVEDGPGECSEDSINLPLLKGQF